MTEGRSDPVPRGIDPGIATVVSDGARRAGQAEPAGRAVRSVLSVLLLRCSAAACGLAVTVVLTRHLGPSRFGELSLILTVAVMLMSVGELGTTPVAAAEMAARPERRPLLAAGLAVLRSGGGAVLAVAGGLFLAFALDRSEARWAALAVLAAIPLAGFSGLAVLAQARLRPEVGALLSLVQSAAWLATVAVAAAAGADLPVLGAAYLASVLGQAVATWVVVVRREPPRWAHWRPALRWTLARSWPLAVAAVVGAVYYRIDGILVFQLRGATEAGVYGAAYRFLDVAQLFPIALVSVLLPVLARRRALGDPAGFGSAVALALTVSAAVGAFAAALALVGGDRVAVALFGADFARAGGVLRILGLAVFSLATGYVYSAVLVATGEVKVVGLASAGALVISVAAGLPAIAAWGVTGAAWVTVATELFASTTLGLWIRRHHHVGVPVRRVGASIAAAALVVAFGVPLRGLPVVVLLLICTVAYWPAAIWFGAVTRDDLRALIRPQAAP